jgi:hypothetical protein
MNCVEKHTLSVSKETSLLSDLSPLARREIPEADVEGDTRVFLGDVRKLFGTRAWQDFPRHMRRFRGEAWRMRRLLLNKRMIMRFNGT